MPVSSIKTPLFKTHQTLGAKMVDFAGWKMPIRYGSIIDEHKTVRKSCGVFDVSHMGEISIKGDNARAFLDRLTPGDVETLTEGDVRYSTLLNHDGGIIDDMLIYAISGTRFLLCVNAANTTKDLKWITENSGDFPDVVISDLSIEYGMIALQGPNSENALKSLVAAPLSRLEYYTFIPVYINDNYVLLSRTGYTGEDGFEIFCNSRNTVEIWDKIVTRGKSFGLRPVGLAARDTLRLEMCYPLHGSDIDETTTPLEAGLGWMLKLDKNVDFIGKEALVKQKEKGVTRRLVALKMESRGVPRAGFSILNEGEEVGTITSGTLSPTMNTGIALAYLNSDLTKPGTRLQVRIRDTEADVKVVKGPFVSSRIKKKIINNEVEKQIVRGE